MIISFKHSYVDMQWFDEFNINELCKILHVLVPKHLTFLCLGKGVSSIIAELRSCFLLEQFSHTGSRAIHP